MRVSTSIASNGLSMKSRAPASSASSFLSGSAVTASTGSHALVSTVLNTRMTSRPFMTGMCRSRMIRS